MRGVYELPFLMRLAPICLIDDRSMFASISQLMNFIRTPSHLSYGTTAIYWRLRGKKISSATFDAFPASLTSLQPMKFDDIITAALCHHGFLFFELTPSCQEICIIKITALKAMSDNIYYIHDKNYY